MDESGERRAASGEDARDVNGADEVESVPGTVVVRTREVPPPDQLNWRRGVLVGTSLISCLILIAIIALFVYTGTDWGRERVRRYAENWLNHMVHGQVKIGRLSGNLLTGTTVHNFTITDSTGKPFVAVESFTGDYSAMSLLRKRIWIRHAVIVRPLVVVDKPPNGHWNWRLIFPRDTTPKPPSQQLGWGDFVRFTDAKVVDGQLFVRTAWHPSEHLAPPARDSAIREVMSGRSRLMVERVPGGFEKIIALKSVTASIPLLRLAEPGYTNRLATVSSMQMLAYPFREPGAVVRDIKGVFPFNDDSVWWKGVYGELPSSKMSGDGSFVFNTGDLTLAMHGEPASFADMRWVYPRLPTGNGKFDLHMTWRGAAQDYAFTNVNSSLQGGARFVGSLGFTLTDTTTIHDTDFRFSGVDTRLLEQLVPGLRSPRRGTLGGRLAASGGMHGMHLDADVTFDDQRAGVSRVVALGDAGVIDGGGLAAHDLRLDLRPLQVDMVRTWLPTLPVSGVVSGTARVNGSTNRELSISGDLQHVDRGLSSVVSGTARVRRQASGDRRQGIWFDVEANAHPVSLAEVGRFFPKVGLQGTAVGPVHITGTMNDLRFNVDVALPDRGHLVAQGTFDLQGQKAYDVTATMRTLNLRSVLARAPVTSLSARASARGAGTDPATMRATLAADLATSRWDPSTSLGTIAVDSASVRLNVAQGLADVQRLEARGAHTTASARGSFGLVRGTTGTLTYRVAVDSLGAYNRWLPRGVRDTGAVAPRPGIVMRAVQRAKADSARVDRVTEVERAISGRPGPKLVVRAPPPVRRDTIAGTLSAAGTMRGNIYDFDLRGRAGGEHIVARGNFVRRFQSEYVWTNARSPESNLVLALDADSVAAMGFWFDTASVRLTFAKPSGHAEVLVRQGSERDYMARGDFTINPDRKIVRLANLTLRLDTVVWTSPHPSTVQWGGPGIQVTDFELRNRGTGRVYAHGLLPTAGVADFTLAVDNFPIGNLTDLVQSDLDLGGILTLRGSMTGTLSNPAFRGAYGLAGGTYNGQVVPELRGQFGYADRELVTHVDALRNGGQPMAVADARLPINLAFSGVTGDRLLPLPMSVDIVADSFPLELIPSFTDLVSQTSGHAVGRVAMRGTLRRPSLTGALFVTRGHVMINLTGQGIDSLTASVRMLNDTVYVDSVVGRSVGPVRLRGTLAIGSWREPSFNLYAIASNAEVLHNEHGRLRADAGLALTGPFRNAYLSGQVNVVQGVIQAPEPTGRHLINAGDPALFNVLDTSLVSERDLFPVQSPLLSNMRVEVALNVNRNTWVRNREANVEIYTEFPLMVRAEHEALALTGVVTTERGEYKFLSKRFQVKRGSALFIGGADLNPTLQVTGEYTVQAAARAAVNIRVLIGGTLRRPRLSLESDIQPPKTQAELLSLLTFGQPTTSLLAVNGSSVTGSVAAGDLLGVGAQLAVKRLAGVAMGVMVDEIESEAGKALGADMLNITPADVPTELIQGRGLGNLLTQTKIEAGKYINPRTFLTGQELDGRFGLGVEHRWREGYQFNASLEPRLLLTEPTLSGPGVKRVLGYGVFVIREWRF
jgi:hypothetical protein